MTKDVDKQSSAVAAMQAEWSKVDALMGGTSAMRAAGEKFLPKWPQEDQKSYDFRLKTSTLFNGYRRTVENMAGKPFSEPVKWSGIDAEIEAWFDNIDLSGRNLHVFAHDVFQAALSYGLSHVLVDYPPTRGEDGNLLYPTVDAEKKAGVRPYALHIKPTSVLGWKSAKVNGVETLTQLRILECVQEDAGEFGTRDVKQVRVLEPGKFTVYRKSEKDEWTVFAEGTTSIKFIPLITVYTRRTGFMTGRPPLIDLADLNIKHWQSQSDQDSILHVARVPILAITGVTAEDADNITIGAKSALTLPTGADAKYVEHSGAAIEAGASSLSDLEEQMRAMGAELLVAQPGDITATQTSVDTAQAQCQLAAMTSALEDSLDAMVDIMAKWAGKGEQGDIDVFDDFAPEIALATVGPFVLSLIQLHSNGLLDKEGAFEELQRYGILNPDKVWADVQAKLGVEGPVLTAPIPTPPVET